MKLRVADVIAGKIFKVLEECFLRQLERASRDVFSKGGTMYTENITGERITIKRCGVERRNSRLVSGSWAGRGGSIFGI